MTLKEFIGKLDVIAVLGFLIAIETQITNGSMSFVHTLPPGWIDIVKEWAANLATVGALLVSIVRMSGSSSPAPSVTSTVIKILIGAFLLSAFLAGSPAMAQTKLRPPQITGNVVDDAKVNLGIAPPANGAPVLTGNIQKDAKALWDKIQALTKDDLTYAIAKATAAKTNASAVRLQCIQAVAEANAQARGDGLVGPDGKPLERPDPALVTQIEDVAELVDNLSPQGKLFTSCAGAAQMFKTNTLAMISAIVTGAAGIAALPAGL